MKPLLFDAATHTYTVEGIVIPSVTQVIGTVYPRDHNASEWHLERGRAIHHATALYDAGRLNHASIDPRIAARVDAWANFRKQNPDYRPTLIECAAYHPVHRYAGTIDRVFSAPGETILADIKSSHDKRDQLQLGAYSLLLREQHITPTQGVIVELTDQGVYRCHWFSGYELGKLANLFLATITVYRFATQQLGKEPFQP